MNGRDRAVSLALSSSDLLSFFLHLYNFEQDASMWIMLMDLAFACTGSEGSETDPARSCSLQTACTRTPCHGEGREREEERKGKGKGKKSQLGNLLVARYVACHSLLSSKRSSQATMLFSLPENTHTHTHRQRKREGREREREGDKRLATRIEEKRRRQDKTIIFIMIIIFLVVCAHKRFSSLSLSPCLYVCLSLFS